MAEAASKDFFPAEVHSAKTPDLEGIRRGSKGGKGTAEAAKREVLRLLGKGYKVREAMTAVGRSEKTYEYWRKSDPEFKDDANRVMGRRRRKSESERVEVPEFPEFCEKYLGMRLFWHQLQWYDILEGREPRDLHPAQTYIRGTDPHMLLVNTPPGFAKSTTINAAYTLWRMLKNPNSQIVIISKNDKMAKKWMFQIQDWLTSRSFEKLQNDFGPADGFAASSPIWNSTQIYFGPELRDQNAKDPTLEVLGMHGTIYGARADLIILDDCVDSTNAHQFDDQIDWMTGMVLTRPADEDKVLVIGTRVAPVDLYKELMNPNRYDDGQPPWTYFAQPAVLEFADDPKDWVTLWPKSNIVKRGTAAVPDEDGLYPKWDGPSLNRMRKRIATDPRAWPLKYQQEDVAEDSVFHRDAVYGCVNKARRLGPLDSTRPGCPEQGMNGMRVIAGFDPASSGFTAAVAVAFDPRTEKRWVLDLYNKQNSTPDQNRDLMLRWTEKYNISEWRVEKVLLSQYILQDRELTRKLATLGCTIHPHITNSQTKWDADGGVMSLTGLFQGWESGDNLLDLPSTNHEVVRAMCEQFITFEPKTRNPTDLLMALWFAEARIRQLILMRSTPSAVESKWSTPRDRRRPLFRKRVAA